MKRRSYYLENDKLAGINFVIERMINEQPSIPVNIWFPLKQNVVALKPVVDMYREGTLKIIGNNAERAEDGGIKTTEDGRYVYPDTDSEKRAKEELQALGDIKVKVALIPLTLEVVGHFGERFFADWNTLEPILDVRVEDEPNAPAQPEIV